MHAIEAFDIRYERNITMPTTELIVSDDSSLAATGLSNDLIARCLALRLTRPQIFAVTQLNKLYDCPSEEIVTHVENGIALPRVAECLRLRNELEELEDSDVETVNEYVGLIDFRLPNEIDDFATNKIIYMGRALTAEQFEDVLIQQITGEGAVAHHAPAGSIVEHPHDKIIETLLEGIHDAFAESSDPVKELLKKIKDELDGNVLLAYHLCVHDSQKFRQFMEGTIDTHSLHYVKQGADADNDHLDLSVKDLPEKEDDDTPLYEEI